MKPDISDLMKYSVLLVEAIILFCLVCYYSQPSFVLPSLEPQGPPCNEGGSLGVAHVLPTFNLPIPQHKPDINEIITLTITSVICITSATVMLNGIRKGCHIPIRE